MDDSELISLAQSGNMDAAQQLLRGYESSLKRFFRQRLSVREDAEDAFQTLCLRVIRGIGGYAGRGSFKGWLFQIARHEVTNVIRSRAQRPRTEVGEKALDKVPAPVEPPYQPLIKQDDLGLLRAYIDQLPEVEREVILLRTQSELKFREIAERTEAPLNTVLGRMRNATRRLKKLIEETRHPNYER